MASPEVSARLQFLHEAAHLLVLPAPETSRHLMLDHNALLSDRDPGSSEVRQNSCGACGTIMVVGWEGRLEIESNRTKSKKAKPGRKGEKEEKGKSIAKPQHQASKTMIYTCDSCRRTTRFPITLPTKPGRHNLSSHQVQLSKFAPPEKLSMSSNVKKRTKSKKGGLAAILAKQKEAQSNTSAGFGLNLMDFMKKS